jgi:hypothetical protein
LRSAFRKISRVGNLSGGTKWYLNDDCLLAAKRTMYTVEYRRFYLRDLESIVVWPSRIWLLRPAIPFVLFLAFGALFWQLVDLTTGAIVGSIGLLWAVIELALGPTAEARIRTTGAVVDLPVVKRTRRARRLLATIDEAVRAARAGNIEEVATPATPPRPAVAEPATADSAAPSTTSPIGNLT